MKEYHKIKSLYERDPRTKKVIEGKFVDLTVKFLENTEWVFTEKIDGMNIRVVRDRHKVGFYGRTDKSHIPANLTNRLLALFGGDANEQLFEQKFGGKFVMLCGEGYGAGIQEGGNYIDTQDFILFDVMIADPTTGNFWLERHNVEDIAKYFGIETVPISLTGTIREAVDYVKTNPNSAIGTAKSEGVVGRPKTELYDRRGERIIVKIKYEDFKPM